MSENNTRLICRVRGSKIAADIHPDPFYRTYSSTDAEHACHRGIGPAGILGAETTDCDTPLSLVNETFRWINENLKDTIDFVIWTGDSARHDNDEKIPRSEEQVLGQNRMLVDKMVEVFGKDDNIDDPDPTNDFILPIIPTFGNNDILPHNIFTPGPNRWTKKYARVWDRFVPEEQRHSFARGGWFFNEVIPNKLAVFSLNSLYFFDSNAAVDGCDRPSEPGYEQLEWLRIQLQFLRARGMKAIMTGHVPPARTDSKQNWDETCWQKYTLWMRQYRDVVVGAVWGHMNIDHFMFHDMEELRYKSDADFSNYENEYYAPAETRRDTISQGGQFTIQSASDYLSELRQSWHKLPSSPEGAVIEGDEQVGASKKKRSRKQKEKKFLRKIGGEWAERFSVSLVSPSVIPNYYPTLRVVEYNITGLEDTKLEQSPSKPANWATQDLGDDPFIHVDDSGEATEEDYFVTRKSKKSKKHKKPGFKVPRGPSKTSPPGPAYSPQTLTWLSYVQYYGNLTYINNDFHNSTEAVLSEFEKVEPNQDDRLDAAKKWRDGKHADKDMPDKVKRKKPQPNKFEYEIEYDTRNDSIYGLKDMTVRSYFDLAQRIGTKKPKKGDRLEVMGKEDDGQSEVQLDEDLQHMGGAVDASKKGKGKHRKVGNKVWYTFIKRAFVNTMEDGDVDDVFGK